MQQFSEIERQGHWQVAHKWRFMRHLSVSPMPNLGITLQLPQSDLTPWTLTLIWFPEMAKFTMDHSVYTKGTKHEVWPNELSCTILLSFLELHSYEYLSKSLSTYCTLSNYPLQINSLQFSMSRYHHSDLFKDVWLKLFCTFLIGGVFFLEEIAAGKLGLIQL